MTRKKNPQAAGRLEPGFTFSAEAAQPQSPPQPGFFRRASARNTSHAAATATTERAAMD
jgi:hypothetical protein